MQRVHRGSVIARNGEFAVIDCRKCGYAHLQDLPTQQEVDAYYTRDEFYRTHSPDDWFEKEKREHEGGYWQSAYDYEIDLLESRSQVVDVGCGTGYFIHHYRRSGSVAYGIEPSASAREVSPLHHAYLFQDIAHLRQNVALGHSTDSARMAFVLEHLLDPLYHTLEVRNALVGPQGRLLITVPNEFNPLQRRVEQRVDHAWYVQKPHINYFDRQSIRRLLKACGFKVVYQGGTFPMELMYLMGYHYIGNDTIGRRVHNWRLRFEKLLGPSVYKLYHLLYNKLGWGRETIIVGERYET